MDRAVFLWFIDLCLLLCNPLLLWNGQLNSATMLNDDLLALKINYNCDNYQDVIFYCVSPHLMTLKPFHFQRNY